MVRNQVQIENPKKLLLPTEVEAVLKRTFATHQRVIIKAELGSGFSGSRVFLVHPIRDAPELPAVVKIAPANLVEREYQAYQKHIRNKLSGAAEIRSEPISLPDSDWAGLCYRLVGSGIFEIESLNSFCRHASVQDIWHILEKRLFKRIAPLWQFSHTSPQFSLQASYDRLLPVNLLLGPTVLPPGALHHRLSPDALPDRSFKQGDYVRMERFVVTEIDPDQRTVTLNLPASTNQPTINSFVSYRVRLQPVDEPSPYQVNDVIDAVECVVTATRDDLLRSYARRALGLDFAEAVTAKTLTLPGDTGVILPNPLLVLPDILSEPHHVRVACIHGDLNMENILVALDTGDVRLIDFAMARQDHVTCFDEWLDQVEQVLGQNTALLALDEFEALDGALAKGHFDETAVMGMLRHLIQHRPRFKVLLAGSHTLDDLQRWSSYLINVQVVHIGYLEEDETRQLVEQPVKDFALRATSRMPVSGCWNSHGDTQPWYNCSVPRLWRSRTSSHPPSAGWPVCPT
ncbi:MAG: hypothetical protein V3S14_04485 [Anaerolineae bacterium]